jgi:hypothetical protein
MKVKNVLQTLILQTKSVQYSVIAKNNFNILSKNFITLSVLTTSKCILLHIVNKSFVIE